MQRSHDRHVSAQVVLLDRLLLFRKKYLDLCDVRNRIQVGVSEAEALELGVTSIGQSSF